jgi:flagellar motor protein MotB
VKAAPRQRWALSFADLCLLLLGFFVMLQARPEASALAAGFRQAFGMRERAVIERRAAALFQPGEALLTPRGRALLDRFVAEVGDDAVIVASRGTEPATARFDGWELAAARAAAVARAIEQAGVPQRRITLAVDPSTGGGQVIHISRI